jgi:AraC-like DNA-binding protein
VLASFEYIITTSSVSWKVHRVYLPRFEPDWHFHPEYELTCILQGAGTRLVGDSVEDYVAGDVTLIGPELPHTYVSTPGPTMHEAIVVQFRRDFLGESFFENPEFAAVAAMLDRASRGLTFDAKSLMLERLEQLEPAERTVALLQVLVDLSHLPPKVLGSEQDTPALSRATAERIEAMVGAILSGYELKLTLADIAAAAHLSPSSASRLFRRCTGSTITRYVNVVRVNAACRLLRDTDRSIASIATDCGYVNLSNFNQRFREVKYLSPREYRRNFALI